MKSIEEYVREYTAVVQAEVPNEQVLAVAMLGRPGGLSRVAVVHVSYAAAAIMNHGAKDASGGLPQSVIVGVTPTRLVVFDYKPKMTSIKLKGLVAEWGRDGLQVTGERGSLATRLTFTWPNGSQVQLDSNRSVGSYDSMNDAFLATLGCTVTGG